MTWTFSDMALCMELVNCPVANRLQPGFLCSYRENGAGSIVHDCIDIRVVVQQVHDRSQCYVVVLGLFHFNNGQDEIGFRRCHHEPAIVEWTNFPIGTRTSTTRRWRISTLSSDFFVPVHAKDSHFVALSGRHHCSWPPINVVCKGSSTQRIFNVNVTKLL